MNLSPPKNAALAARLGCTVRTVQNIRARGYNPANPIELSRYLTSIQNPSLAMLKATAAALEFLTTQSHDRLPKI